MPQTQPAKKVATIKTVRKTDGPITCPRKTCGGQVVEVDTAIRWNYLYVEEGRVRTSTDGDAHFERDEVGFICETCMGPVAFSDEPDIDYD